MGRITMDMKVTDVIYKMSEGNPGAIRAMMVLIEETTFGLPYLLQLDELEIYGEKIYMLWNDCCNRDRDKFIQTLDEFARGKFTKEEIHENLSQVRATPFI